MLYKYYKNDNIDDGFSKVLAALVTFLVCAWLGREDMG